MLTPGTPAVPIAMFPDVGTRVGKPRPMTFVFGQSTWMVLA